MRMNLPTSGACDACSPHQVSDSAAAYRGASAPLFDTRPAEALIAKHRELNYPYECTFGDARLEIDKGVFCPTLTNTSPLLLESIDFGPSERVLDVFAGSGAFAINAALRGATVVTVDIDPLAVACAAKNARLNRVKESIDIRQGCIHTGLSATESFELIIANPPLLPEKRAGPLGVALFDPGLRATVAFVESLRYRLSRCGRCYLLSSDVMERCGYDVEPLCIRNDLTASLVAKSDFGYESYRVHKVTR